MPRRRLVISFDLPYHVTARVNNREIFPGELAFTWKTLTNELYLQTVLHSVRIHAFVLMPNHFHLLLTTPRLCISKTMQDFMSAGTRIINSKYRRSGHLFGSRYYWSVIDNPFYYAHALKYVYRNPVKAGLCETVDEYLYSILHGLWGKSHLPVPILPADHHINRVVPISQEGL